MAETNLYRVRKSWDDPSSQIGAYAILDNAKKACIEGYYVFDSNGTIVYPIALDEKEIIAKVKELLAEFDVFYKSIYETGSQIKELLSSSGPDLPSDDDPADDNPPVVEPENPAKQYAEAMGAPYYTKTLKAVDLGCAGDGKSDDTKNLLNAINQCKAQNAALDLDGKTYLIGNNLDVAGGSIHIIGRGATLLLSMLGKKSTREHQFILGASYCIDSVNFIKTDNTNSKGIKIYGCKNSLFYNCYFETDSLTSNAATIDFYGNNTNLETRKCKFLTKLTTKQGGIWIRSIGSVSHDLLFKDCQFYHLSGDEAFAIYGSVNNGKLYNVVMEDCYVECLAKPNSNYKYYPTGLIRLGITYYTSNIVLKNCTIKDNHIGTFTVFASDDDIAASKEAGNGQNLTMDGCDIFIGGQGQNNGNYCFATTDSAYRLNLKNCTINTDKTVTKGMFYNCNVENCVVNRVTTIKDVNTTIK